MVIATLLLGAAGPNLLVHKQRDAFSHWLAALMLEPPGHLVPVLRWFTAMLLCLWNKRWTGSFVCFLNDGEVNDRTPYTRAVQRQF